MRIMGRFLGVDVGTKTLGLAVSDEGGTLALPLAVVRRAGLARDLAAVAQWIEGRDVTDVVVGLPLELDGAPGRLSGEADAVAAALAEELGLIVHRWDERLSTVAAERALLEADLSRRRRRQVVDKVAATLILQAFLDRRAVDGRP
jgi:putative Holliday junction resolvase